MRTRQAAGVCEWSWQVELELIDGEIAVAEEELELLREYRVVCMLKINALPAEGVWPEAEW